MVSELTGESGNTGRRGIQPLCQMTAVRLPATVCTPSSSGWPEFHLSMCEYSAPRGMLFLLASLIPVLEEQLPIKRLDSSLVTEAYNAPF